MIQGYADCAVKHGYVALRREARLFVEGVVEMRCVFGPDRATHT